MTAPPSPSNGFSSSPQEVAEINQPTGPARNLTRQEMTWTYNMLRQIVQNNYRMIARIQNSIAETQNSIDQTDRVLEAGQHRLNQSATTEATEPHDLTCCERFFGRNYYVALMAIAALGALLGAFVTCFLHPHNVGYYFVGAGIGLLTLSTVFLLTTSKKTWGKGS